MRPRAFTGSVIALLAILAAAPAPAQLYKWVDERGVTNYSNQPPADPKTAKNLRPVPEDRLSVYSPDEGLLQAIEDSHKNIDQRLSQRAKIESLENQLEAERRARQQAATAVQVSQSAYEKCLADGRLDCNAIYGVAPYGPPVVFFPKRHRRKHIPQTVLPPGAIAGNVTGGNGFIPGNSAAANGTTAGTAAGTKGMKLEQSAKMRARKSPAERPLLERR
jgi:Skp family chaperone for outer membrane proteins